jgi:phosphate transport system substrate-binding protein
MRTLFFIALTILYLGCSSEEKETTTRGKLQVFIPESVAPVMIDEVNAFLDLYKPHGAQITYTVVSSRAAADHFLKDTARIAFLPRPLTLAEKESVKKISTGLNELIVAYDGIAAVVHPKNKMEQMTTTEIREILSGKITHWEQLAPAKHIKGALNIYCQDSSDVTEYLVQRLLKQTGITAKFMRTTSDLQTLQAVEKDPLSLGFAALSWIDPGRTTVKILDLGRTKEDTDTTFAPPPEALGKFFSPIPAYIYLNYYPLKRSITMYTLAQVDLAAGFGTYVATVEGQKLFLKHGLLPATQKIKLRSN